MGKQPTVPSILNLFKIFNTISKYTGFAIMKPDDSFSSKLFREIVFFILFSFLTLITFEVEGWFFTDLRLKPTLRKIVIFVISQFTVLAPFFCILSFRLRDFTIWKIVLRVKNLEENLIFCNINAHLHNARIGFIGLFFWLFEFSVVLSLDFCTMWRLLRLFDIARFYYFEATSMIPCLQFVIWISFLSYVLHLIQLEIIEINKLVYLTSLNFCNVIEKVGRITCKSYELDRVIKVKRFVCLMKQVLKISEELSAAYGSTVFIYLVQYISRIILQLYDLLDKDSQISPLGMAFWSLLARLVSILPVFICCEHFSQNVNKTVELIQEMVMLHQPSPMDCVYKNLTLRLQHQSTTIQICGFLNITYSSFLAIMTTALAFLVLQLQL